MGHNFTGSHTFNKHRMQAAQLGLAPITFNLSSKGWKMCAIVAWGLDRNYPALSCNCQHSSGTNSEDDKSVIVVQSPITWFSAQQGCISELEQRVNLFYLIYFSRFFNEWLSECGEVGSMIVCHCHIITITSLYFLILLYIIYLHVPFCCFIILQEDRTKKLTHQT